MVRAVESIMMVVGPLTGKIERIGLEEEGLIKETILTRKATHTHTHTHTSGDFLSRRNERRF